MTPFNFTVEDKQGKRTSMYDLGVLVLSLQLPSPTVSFDTERAEGSDGEYVLSSNYNPRPLNAKCFVDVRKNDHLLIRSKLFKLFPKKEEFFILPDNQPDIRWKVRLSSDFTVDPNSGMFSLNFTIPKVFAESRNEIKVTKSTSSFPVYNYGDMAIDPTEHDLKIVFKGDVSSQLSIKNETNGDEWIYTGSATATDEIVIDKIRCTKNLLSIYRETNRKIIRLDEGGNDFSISGATNYTITFLYRHLHY
ncbi:phage tail domain-containing protein [Bacillus sp. 2205SS5-2]|uniref:phage tail domain-containing protein n=1 Tax=Bacillus sp. 2205SS5-2 TaxID=3109031 RepID=UPI0030050765